jgi:hypothetical protein
VTLTLTQSFTAVAPNITSSFLGVGGTEPYLYEVLAGGAGGTINATTGTYTAPAVASSDPSHIYDTVQVTDYVGATATAQILVGTPLLLLCEIIQNQLGLANGRVYLWDQKIQQPQDSGLYVAVSVPSCKPFANVNEFQSLLGGAESNQYVSMQATVDLDIISRGPEARDRKEEVVMALGSLYAQQQQEANSFFIGKLPPDGRFLNLSTIDGAAIPYRYKISFYMQYVFTKGSAAPYIDTFSTVSTYTNP